MVKDSYVDRMCSYERVTLCLNLLVGSEYSFFYTCVGRGTECIRREQII